MPIDRILLSMTALSSGIPASVRATSDGVLYKLAWYALWVHSNAEKRVAAALEERCYTSYLPLYRQRSRWSDRVKTLDRVLFPGYVFCRFDPSQRVFITGVPGITKIVGFNTHLATIPESEIEAVRRLVSSGLPAIPWPYLKEGDRIRITKGALEGIEGILCQNKSELRVVVSINLLQRSVSVEIDRECIEPIQSCVLPR
jgi:transcription antitermination factor NusG